MSLRPGTASSACTIEKTSCLHEAEELEATGSPERRCEAWLGPSTAFDFRRSQEPMANRCAASCWPLAGDTLPSQWQLAAPGPKLVAFSAPLPYAISQPTHDAHAANDFDACGVDYLPPR